METVEHHPKRLTADTVAVSFGTLARTASQAIVLVIVARCLGPESYAALTAVFSIALAFAAMSGAGTQVLLVKEISSGTRALQDAWASALGGLALTSVPLALLGILLSLALAPKEADPQTVIAICLAEVMLAPWCVVSAAVFQARSAMQAFAFLSVIPSITRVFAGIALLAYAGTAQQDMLKHWAYLYLGASLAAALLCHAAAQYCYGRARASSMAAITLDIRSAFPFAASSVAQSAYGAVDKVLVARLCEGSTAGAYALAIRLIELATIPAWSAVAVLAPRLFRDNRYISTTGVRRMGALQRVVVPPIVLSIVVAASTPLITLLFGSAYEEATQIVTMLAAIPAIMAVRILLYLRLNTSGRQRQAAIALSAGFFSSSGLNAVLLPELAARGAAIALLASETIMIVWMVLALHHKAHAPNENRRAVP